MHSQSARRLQRRIANAEIAQLVERNLAKVEVAGPSPVFRSSGQKKRVNRELTKSYKALYITDMQGFFFYPPPLLSKQKAASILRLNRDLFCPDRKQVTIWIYFADSHHFTLQHPGAENVSFTQKSSSPAPSPPQCCLLLQKARRVEKGTRLRSVSVSLR